MSEDKRLVEFALEGDDRILVEVRDSRRGTCPAGRDDVVDRAKKTFGEAIDRLKPLATTVISKLRDINDPADEVEVEFGVKINAEADMILASGSAEANYKVTLKWKKNP